MLDLGSELQTVGGVYDLLALVTDKVLVHREYQRAGVLGCCEKIDGPHVNRDSGGRGFPDVVQVFDDVAVEADDLVAAQKGWGRLFGDEPGDLNLNMYVGLRGWFRGGFVLVGLDLAVAHAAYVKKKLFLPFLNERAPRSNVLNNNNFIKIIIIT